MILGAETTGAGRPQAPSPADLITTSRCLLVRAGRTIEADEDGPAPTLGAVRLSLGRFSAAAEIDAAAAALIAGYRRLQAR
ncbi:hypothetical protein AB4Z40_29290 [Bosea sp. 2YAB26]|uniref:hypothetical protein n=1 Tax=Bosea sp. 2YAB26 TaxID=3237478 RepID=UPI003F934718